MNVYTPCCTSIQMQAKGIFKIYSWYVLSISVRDHTILPPHGDKVFFIFPCIFIHFPILGKEKEECGPRQD